MKRYTITNNSGFTLLELMVTVGIIGFLAAMAIPAWWKMQPHLRLKTAARDVANVMEQAKMAAVANNKYTDVVVDEMNNTVSWRYVPDGELHNIDRWLDVKIVLSNNIIGTDDIAPYPEVDATYGRYIRFRPDGSTTIVNVQGQQAVYLQNKSKSNELYRVKVTSTGLIKIQTYISTKWR